VTSGGETAFVRTDDSRFDGIGWEWPASWFERPDGLRQHYVDEASKAGARRFPFCIPFGEPELGDAALQAEARAALRTWDIPTHVAFGDQDPIFPWEWPEQWAAEMGATLDRIEGASHFVQAEAPDDCVALLRRYVG
jgi:pimeloyl-ACP methyl ester carboxylesterase